jgi:hypothetical protein
LKPLLLQKETPSRHSCCSEVSSSCAQPWFPTENKKKQEKQEKQEKKKKKE